METVLTGWSDITELRYDAAAHVLTVVYHSGEMRKLSRVDRDALDRFLGRPPSPTAVAGLQEERAPLAEGVRKLGRSLSPVFNVNPWTAGG
jgi:hypothetical protein